MIKTITVTNHMSESVVFDLRNPEQSGFFIRGIDGLGPVKATINTTEALSLDGSRFNSARAGERNVVFSIGFLENPTIEDSRQKTYKYFPLKTLIKITIETDNRLLHTTGYVEFNEPNIFSKEEGTSISIICPDPYFHSEIASVVNFSSTESLFSFPFSNESLTEKLIIFGNMITDPQNNVFYTGEVPIGFVMFIHALGSIGTFTIFNLGTKESMMIDADILEALTGSGLVSGDELVISTVKGDKYVTLKRGGESINVLNSLGPDSEWLTLRRGDNVFYYTADFGEANLQFRIEYEAMFEGI